MCASRWFADDWNKRCNGMAFERTKPWEALAPLKTQHIEKNYNQLEIFAKYSICWTKFGSLVCGHSKISRVYLTLYCGKWKHFGVSTNTTIYHVNKQYLMEKQVRDNQDNISTIQSRHNLCEVACCIITFWIRPKWGSISTQTERCSRVKVQIRWPDIDVPPWSLDWPSSMLAIWCLARFCSSLSDIYIRMTRRAQDHRQLTEGWNGMFWHVYVAAALCLNFNTNNNISTHSRIVPVLVQKPAHWNITVFVTQTDMYF